MYYEHILMLKSDTWNVYNEVSKSWMKSESVVADSDFGWRQNERVFTLKLHFSTLSEASVRHSGPIKKIIIYILYKHFIVK